MMDALSCGAVVLGSDTSPVKEMIRHGENGLLADFFNPEDFANKAIEALKDPAAARAMGRAAEQMIVEKYSLEAVVPRMVKMYEEAANLKLPGWDPVRTTTENSSIPTQDRIAPARAKPPANRKSPFL
jgi:glycosyltransferase involved in cell wall biosynthesis